MKCWQTRSGGTAVDALTAHCAVGPAQAKASIGEYKFNGAVMAGLHRRYGQPTIEEHVVAQEWPAQLSPNRRYPCLVFALSMGA